jgi:carbonic anhydrase
MEGGAMGPVLGFMLLVVGVFLPFPAHSGSTAQEPMPGEPEDRNPYLQCEKGKRQSPIDLRMPVYARHGDLVFAYKPTELPVLHDGHSVRVIHEAKGQLRWEGRSYRLLQFHLHDPSEHWVNGTAYTMEMHLVHKDPRGHVLVIAVLIEFGAENREMDHAGRWVQQHLGHRLPEAGEELRGTLTLDIMKILPTNTTNFYTYDGSLTTPPCTEGVRWIVLKDPIQFSRVQVDRFVKAYGHTARPLQPLHDREMEVN